VEDRRVQQVPPRERLAPRGPRSSWSLSRLSETIYRSLYVQARGALKNEFSNTLGQDEQSVVPGMPA